ncbi:hypothetical protein [Pseudooceanicola onchidii]|uniref:hypothetical protein n=1 Tax=Pseudooceanicola onchidii TaxID=2562279 RepID=UPI0010A9F28D|nr:hypothetical protein [Pseudooceanicola onchidii]
MIFVWLSRILAAALIALGAIKVGLGLYVARTFTAPADYEAATRRYIGSGTTGDAIDQGIVFCGLGIALGLLAFFLAKRPTAARH